MPRPPFIRSGRILRSRSLTLVLLLLLGVRSSWAVDTAGFFAALESIRSADLQGHVNILADDAMEGRAAGSRGGRAAADYLAQHLAAAGLKPCGTDGYFQPFGRGCRNVLGLVEGSDPDLKDEYVLIGAHYDHVGYGNRHNSLGPIGQIHNGGDDNASGVSGVLETLDALQLLPRCPKRSILFAFWDGEEQGLWGSKHFTAAPTVPLDKIVLLVNVDMIGRLRDQRLIVYGTRTGSGLRRFLAEINRDPALELEFDWELRPNSDHYPFFEKQIPVLLFHTGLHDDLHRPSDDADRIHAEGMQQIARLIFRAVFEAADRDEFCRFRTAVWHESAADRKRLDQPLPPAPPRLGVRWLHDSDARGLWIAAVDPGSAAERSGLQAGDRLLQFGEFMASDGETLRPRVLAARSPVQALVERPGAAETLSLLLELDGQPSRLGISWREDAAEPGTLQLSRVLPGSPAAHAGLQAGDRIYAVAGLPFTGSDQFLELVASLPGPLQLTVERRGRLQLVELDVPEPIEPPTL